MDVRRISLLLLQQRPTDCSIIFSGSVQLSLFFFSGVIVGPLFDRGHFRLLLRFGSAIYITSCVLLIDIARANDADFFSLLS